MEHKPIPIAPHYSVSACGSSVINTRTNKPLRLLRRGKGSVLYCNLYHCEDVYCKQVSTLDMARLAFPELSIPDPMRVGLPQPKGKESPSYGLKRGKSTREKMRKAKLGVKHPQFKGYYVVDGVKYPTPAKASEFLKIPAGTIRDRCKRKPNKWGNFYFEQILDKSKSAETPVNTE